jgi:putative transcriptional regulator
VVLILDREPNGITTAIAINRPLQQRVIDSSALALLFVPEPSAPAFWGGPMGSDPAILAQFSDVDGLEWFHLPIQQRRPFVLPDVGLIAVAEHPGPLEGRVRRARLFVGLCVWGRGQLEAEVRGGGWLLRQPTLDDLFSTDPEGMWADLLDRAQPADTLS